MAHQLNDSPAQTLRMVKIVHNMIVGILEGQLAAAPTEEEREQLYRYCQALCWVLGHTDAGSPGGDFSDTICKLADRALAETEQQFASRINRHKAN